MEIKNKLERIKSIYLLKGLFNYIKDENYHLKVFKYSKSFQKKMGINLIDYQELYIFK